MTSILEVPGSSVSSDGSTDSERDDGVQSTHNGRTYCLIESSELKSLKDQINELKDRNLELERSLKKARDQSPHNQEFYRGDRLITWLRDNELLLQVGCNLASAGLCCFFPAYAIPLMLANGGCISFIRYLVK